jgi:hypothetical protein
LIAEIRAKAAEVGVLVQLLRDEGPHLDQRWINIGATDIQQGFMALTRGVAKPSSF